MTQQNFMTAYRAELTVKYEWARDISKLDRFMFSVSNTLNGANTWSHEGEAVIAAWRAIGGKGKPTKKALRALAA